MLPALVFSQSSFR